MFWIDLLCTYFDLLREKTIVSHVGITFFFRRVGISRRAGIPCSLHITKFWHVFMPARNFPTITRSCDEMVGLKTLHFIRQRRLPNLSQQTACDLKFPVQQSRHSQIYDISLFTLMCSLHFIQAKVIYIIYNSSIKIFKGYVLHLTPTKWTLANSILIRMCFSNNWTERIPK